LGESRTLRISAGGRELVADGSAPVVVGRGGDADVVLADQRVSRRHALLRPEPDGWVLEDAGSTNGTWLDGAPVGRMAVAGLLRLRLGNPVDGSVLELDPGPGDGSAAGSGAVQPPATRRVRIGRARDNDLVVDDLVVSRHHAELRLDPGSGVEVVDLGSHNGTFVGGRRVERARLAPGEPVMVGHHSFRVVDGVVEEHLDGGDGGLEAVGLSVATRDGKVLLDDVGFAVGPRSLVAVVGPTGAGKSTLLHALTGFRPAPAGTVTYAGHDLYRDYDAVRQWIGFVPQDDILHRHLGVQRALEFAAELRFPADSGREERARRVAEVMTELGLGDRAHLPVAKLSGGQRKRTNVALELLTKPSLLFLDEPTSGLDPGYEKAVMRLLRDLADGGRIVVVATHSMQSLGLCDRVLFLAPGGVPAFFGPPAEALGYFGAGDWPDVFEALEHEDPASWRERFHRHPAHHRYVQAPLAAATPRRAPAPPGPPPSPLPWRRQAGTLTRRYLAIIRADRRNLGLLVLQAPLLGLLLLAVMGAGGLRPDPTGVNLDARKVLLALVLTATWLGSSNAIREIVKERPIFRRERAAGVTVSAYVAAKVTVLSCLTVAQTGVLAAVALARQGGPRGGVVLAAGTAELMLDITLAGLAAMTLCLLVSALVSNADKALTLLPLLLIPQLVLAGVLFETGDTPVLREAGHLASARWGFAAAAATVDLPALEPIRCDGPRPRTADCAQPWRHDPATWLGDLAALLGLVAASVLATVAVLRRGDRRGDAMLDAPNR
jgi:ABC-type multidrug transport system ATPase subunit/pSer/pThr/pTyr-binding forkhead associated (FHA) protein